MSRYTLSISGREYRAEVKEMTPDQATVIVDETEYVVNLVEIGRRETGAVEIQRPARQKIASVALVSAPSPTPAGQHGNVRAPLPGLVLEVKVGEGATVRAGDPLVILEAMKMENMIPAPHDGTVRKVFAREGESIGEGDPLLELSRPEMTTL